MADIKQVGVLGAGLMGHGIAQVAAQAGYEVVLREVDEATLAKGVGKIERQLARALEKGRMSQEELDAVRGRIQGTVRYEDLADCDLLIEAIQVAKYPDKPRPHPPLEKFERLDALRDKLQGHVAEDT